MDTYKTNRIFKRDTTGKIRFWLAEVEGNRYRTIAGIEGEPTSEVTSGWTNCNGKQGRNDEQQAHFEAHAEQTKKLDREYRRTIADVDTRVSAWVKPMLAHKYEGWLGPCFSQPKLDGIRCIATASGLYSREGKEFLAAPHIQWALAPLFEIDPLAVFDGEFYNHDYHDDFNAIVSAVKRTKPTSEDLAVSEKLVQYHIYDMPSPAGHRPFRIRSAMIEQLLTENPHRSLRFVHTALHDTEENLNLAYDAYLASNYEGQMVRADGAYENKRSRQLLKRKEFLDDEFPVIAVEEGNGNWAGHAKRAVLSLPDGRRFGAGIRGTQAAMKALLGAPTPHTATVRFFAYTPDGVPRFPVVTAFHDAGGRL